MPKKGFLIMDEYLPYITDFGAFIRVKARHEEDLRDDKLFRGGYSELDLVGFKRICERKFIRYNPRHVICRDIGKVIFKTNQLFWSFLLNPDNHPVIKSWHGEFGNASFLKRVKGNE